MQKDLERLGEWVVENAMKINTSKSKAVRFTRARVEGSTILFVNENIITGNEQL